MKGRDVGRKKKERDKSQRNKERKEERKKEVGGLELKVQNIKEVEKKKKRTAFFCYRQ